MSAAPTHHPPEALLAHHAAGQLDLAERVLIESHLGFCTACAAGLADLSLPGQRWLEEQPVVAPKPGIYDALEAQIETESATEDPLADIPLPAGARGELGPTGRTPRFHRLPLSRARFAFLHVDKATGCQLVAVRLPGGHVFPRHEHLGTEGLVVLTGAFDDPQGRFGVGDYQENAAGTEHAPQVESGEPCWIVTRYDAGVRFHGLRGLLLKWFGP